MKSIAADMIALAALSALSSCAPQEQSSHLIAQTHSIIGGNLVEDNSDIAASAVVIDIENGKSMCTGTLITEHVVLTAAHCVLKSPDDPSMIPAEKLHLYFGNVVVQIKDPNPYQNYRAQAFAHKVVTFDEHPNKDYRDLHDLALIEFKESLPDGLKPAALASPAQAHDPVLLSKEVLVVGFGISKNTYKPKGPEYLRQVALNINGFEKHSIAELISPEFKPHALCSGDSGGPVYFNIDGRFYLWGVNSKSDCEKYGYVTVASDYQDWILKKAQDLQAEDL
jgi:secreted trypsin-like serine protease